MDVETTASVKNDIKTLFLFFNSFIALGAGVLPLCFTVGKALIDMDPTPAILGLILAMLVVGLAALGCVGAVRDDEKTLKIYLWINCAVVAVDVFGAIAHVVIVTSAQQILINAELIMLATFHVIVTLTLVALAIFLKKHAGSKSESAVGGRCNIFWKCYGFSLLILIVSGYFVKTIFI